MIGVLRLTIRVTTLKLCLLMLPSASLMAQAPQDLQSKVNALESATKSAQMAGDNAWMLVSSALVLMMTGPGLALFYGGLVRRKNVLGTMMQSFILMALITVIWAVVGYSLAFAEGMKFSAMVLFTTLWSLIVYFPMAHMVWGKGGVLNAFLGGRIPCFDF